MNIQACGATQVCLGQASWVRLRSRVLGRLTVSRFTDAQQRNSEILCRISPSQKHCYQEAKHKQLIQNIRAESDPLQLTPHKPHFSYKTVVQIPQFLILFKFLLSLIKHQSYSQSILLSYSQSNICSYFFFFCLPICEPFGLSLIPSPIFISLLTFL